jgi:acyl-CoA thioester hydrolase
MELPISGKLVDSVYWFPVRVYFSDTDAGGVVYHARYLDYAEHARSEMLRLLGENQREMIRSKGNVFVIRSVQAEFHRPALLDDLLAVRTAVTRCGRTVVQFRQDILRDEQLLCSLQVKAGFVSVQSGRPQPMPQEWRQKISSLLQE